MSKKDSPTNFISNPMHTEEALKNSKTGNGPTYKEREASEPLTLRSELQELFDKKKAAFSSSRETPTSSRETSEKTRRGNSDTGRVE